jgi:hypothetical protein
MLRSNHVEGLESGGGGRTEQNSPCGSPAFYQLFFQTEDLGVYCRAERQMVSLFLQLFSLDSQWRRFIVLTIVPLGCIFLAYSADVYMLYCIFLHGGKHRCVASF